MILVEEFDADELEMHDLLRQYRAALDDNDMSRMIALSVKMIAVAEKIAKKTESLA